MILSDRFQEACAYALELHRQQMRKGSRVPYMAHLLAVAALVLGDGGDEDQAIAALLHDAAEDQGGLATLAEIERRFGAQVAQMVADCSDTFEEPKPDWRPRKERYIEHLQGASPAVRRISLADKLHNVNDLVLDLLKMGDAAFTRFKGGKQGTLWYYEALAEEFALDDSPMATELAWLVRKMGQLTQK